MTPDEIAAAYVGGHMILFDTETQRSELAAAIRLALAAERKRCISIVNKESDKHWEAARKNFGTNIGTQIANEMAACTCDRIADAIEGMA